MPMPMGRRNLFLIWGSIIRMIGVVIAGIALILLGILISNPLGFFSPTNPLGIFTSLGSIIILAGVGAILAGIGWSLQTWGVGQILLVDRG